MTEFRLTEYSHGAGCGCKISPAVLADIIKTDMIIAPDPNLLVGNNTLDDAAAYAIDGDTAILSTTDFFMPIVDDPFDFGRIAATNAISDVYAMGGKPIMAIAILGWPVDKLPAHVAQKVVDGGRRACADAGIQLAGGHSIDAPEPIFGLAVTGQVPVKHLKQNNKAQEGDLLYLTKPLGIGVLTTAEKQKKLQPEHANMARDVMCVMNTIGAAVSSLDGVNAITDVTGFGLLGHLSEICAGSDLSAKIDFSSIPTLGPVNDYLDMGCFPGGTLRNYASYGDKIGAITDRQKEILCDPQTSGGLLISVSEQNQGAVEACLNSAGITPKIIGRMVAKDASLAVIVD